jgi:hypothetical protein
MEVQVQRGFACHGGLAPAAAPAAPAAERVRSLLSERLHEAQQFEEDVSDDFISTDYDEEEDSAYSDGTCALCGLTERADADSGSTASSGSSPIEIPSQT